VAGPFDEINKVADVIGKAVAKHYRGNVRIYPTLGALSTIAADIISKAPIDARAELLAAWDESPAWVRSSLGSKQS
jgi:hypothetical protein